MSKKKKTLAIKRAHKVIADGLADARERTREVMIGERQRLDTLPVNPQSTELLKHAAPEHYDILRSYFDRRVQELSSAE